MVLNIRSWVEARNLWWEPNLDHLEFDKDDSGEYPVYTASFATIQSELICLDGSGCEVTLRSPPALFKLIVNCCRDEPFAFLIVNQYLNSLPTILFSVNTDRKRVILREKSCIPSEFCTFNAEIFTPDPEFGSFSWLKEAMLQWVDILSFEPDYSAFADFLYEAFNTSCEPADPVVTEDTPVFPTADPPASHTPSTDINPLPEHDPDEPVIDKTDRYPSIEWTHLPPNERFQWVTVLCLRSELHVNTCYCVHTPRDPVDYTTSAYARVPSTWYDGEVDPLLIAIEPRSCTPDGGRGFDQEGSQFYNTVTAAYGCSRRTATGRSHLIKDVESGVTLSQSGSLIQKDCAKTWNLNMQNTCDFVITQEPYAVSYVLNLIRKKSGWPYYSVVKQLNAYGQCVEEEEDVPGTYYVRGIAVITYSTLGREARLLTQVALYTCASSKSEAESKTRAWILDNIGYPSTVISNISLTAELVYNSCEIDNLV